MISEITSIKSGASSAFITVPPIQNTSRKIVEVDGGANPSAPPPYKYTQLSVSFDYSSLVENIEKIYIGENVKNFYTYGGRLTKLKEIKFKSPDLSSITGTTFDGATNLSCVEGLDDTKIDTLPNRCFRSCSSLSSVSLPPTITTIGSACFSNTDISVNDVLSSLTEISDLPASTFSNLKNTVSDNSHIRIPTKITSIGEACFYNNGCIKDVTFKKAANIGQYTFGFTYPAHNTELSAMYFYRELPDDVLSTDTTLSNNSIPYIHPYAFSDTSQDFEISVYVPTYMYKNWKNDPDWKAINSQSYRHVKILPYNNAYPQPDISSITLDNTKSYIIVDKDYTSGMNFELESTNELSDVRELSATINVYESSDPVTDIIDDSAFNPND